MTDRTGIFAGDDPFNLIRCWMKDAAREEINDPDAAALATVNAEGLPNVRMVLVRYIEDDCLRFFTSYTSTKAKELDAAKKAALVLHWKSIRRQIRVRGIVERESDKIGDEYFASRSSESRLGAWASDQSSILANRTELEARLADAKSKHGNNPKRPEHWGGYRLEPMEIEFWRDGAHRLHDRFVWRRNNTTENWTVNRLYP